ncbi:MAG: hypothetical protein PQ612_05350 [Rickettsiales bacterium]|nr:hypothetical protein [Pseudomonadota bacterium]MDA0966445.1 hypothetical protein [Pseudomonadota bacterium]MDG4543307.1 hypothetical protein [Rickettsiales bacterium]MDG4545573.1 hypothetical protein [Rickettsiales bacterium]MDG4548022.1 hypothetical protein [Rickettsiales bacterium]
MIENKSPDKTIDWDEAEKVLKEDFPEEKIKDILGESADEVFKQIGEDYEGGKLKPRSPDDKQGAWYDSMFHNIYDNIRRQKNLQEDRRLNTEQVILDTEECHISSDYSTLSEQNYLEEEFDNMTSEEKAVIKQLEEESLVKSEPDTEAKKSSGHKPKRKLEMIKPDLNISIAEAVVRRRQKMRENSASIVCR